MHAFTLVELLITIGIIAILGGMVMFNPTRGQETYKLRNTSEEVETVLRKAQGFALAVKDFEGAPPAGGWGVHFFQEDPSSRCYLIFADRSPSGNPNQKYDPSGQENSKPCDVNVVEVQSERFEHVFFPASIKISQLLRNGDPVSELDIVYQPPLLKAFFNGVAAGSSDTAQIVVQSSPLGTSKTITVNSVGNVEVQ